MRLGWWYMDLNMKSLLIGIVTHFQLFVIAACPNIVCAIVQIVSNGHAEACMIKMHATWLLARQASPDGSANLPVSPGPDRSASARLLL